MKIDRMLYGFYYLTSLLLICSVGIDASKLDLPCIWSGSCFWPLVKCAAARLEEAQSLTRVAAIPGLLPTQTLQTLGSSRAKRSSDQDCVSLSCV